MLSLPGSAMSTMSHLSTAWLLSEGFFYTVGNLELILLFLSSAVRWRPKDSISEALHPQSMERGALWLMSRTGVQAINPRLLVFVEGTSGVQIPITTPESAFWGGSLASARQTPVRLRNPSKLVYSPHVYGPGQSLIL